MGFPVGDSWQDSVRELLVGSAGIPAQRMALGLLGCAWGRYVSLLGSDAPCLEPAESIIIIHMPDGRERELRLCPGHRSVVMEFTDPHREGST